MIKVLNLYAGIGGNRKLWKNVEVTAIELDEDIACVYKTFYPEDEVIVTDAHDYLLNYYRNFDFIWSSPPCPSHSRIRFVGTFKGGRNQEPHKPIYPDLKLYEEIIFLKHFFKGKWVVENVISYYEPLIKPFVYKSHYYWSNFIIPNYKKIHNRNHNDGNEALQRNKDIDLSRFDYIKDKRKVLRNCVEPSAGLYIFNCAFKEKQEVLI